MSIFGAKIENEKECNSGRIRDSAKCWITAREATIALNWGDCVATLLHAYIRLSKISHRSAPPQSECHMVTSHIGALVNHLCPRRANGAPGCCTAAGSSGTARVLFARTSLPPCFSVMDMPSVSPFFADMGASEGS